MKLLLLTTLALCLSMSFALRRTQSYSVKGRFMCGSKPAKDVMVKLVDEDDLGADDTLKSGATDNSGRYEITGETNEMTNIDVHFKVYHDCDDGIKPCQRRWKFELPDKYINDAGTTNKKVFDMGTWNLEARLPGEDRDCMH